jgi:2'-5' RNA ligase
MSNPARQENRISARVPSSAGTQHLQARYNFYSAMQKPRYALVAYVKSPVGEFVENLRRELHPDLPHLGAHLTILPPRPLRGTETVALQELERICGQADPFEVALGNVETFIPVTPTVYIKVTHAAERMCELHDRLNTENLAFAEEWPYLPHLTIVLMATENLAQDALAIARKRWTQFVGSRRVLVDHLTFVREDLQNRWVDLAPVPLGRSLVSS